MLDVGNGKRVGRRRDRNLEDRALKRAEWEDLSPNARAAITALSLYWDSDIQAMADEITVRRQAIYSWLAGDTSPNAATLERIKEVTGLSYDELTVLDRTKVYMDGDQIEPDEATRKVVLETLRSLVKSMQPELAKRKGW